MSRVGTHYRYKIICSAQESNSFVLDYFTAAGNIKVKEPTEESLTKKVRQYMDPKFMSVQEAAKQLVQIIEAKPDLGITIQSLAVGLSRVGAPDQRISVMSLEKMQYFDLGPPLHSLVIPGPNLHPLEIDYLAQFR